MRCYILKIILFSTVSIYYIIKLLLLINYTPIIFVPISPVSPISPISSISPLSRSLTENKNKYLTYINICTQNIQHLPHMKKDYIDFIKSTNNCNILLLQENFENFDVNYKYNFIRTLSEKFDYFLTTPVPNIFNLKVIDSGLSYFGGLPLNYEFRSFNNSVGLDFLSDKGIQLITLDKFTIGNLHLQSDNEYIIKLQMNEVCNLIKNFSNVILIGDFNTDLIMNCSDNFITDFYSKEITFPLMAKKFDGIYLYGLNYTYKSKIFNNNYSDHFGIIYNFSFL